MPTPRLLPQHHAVRRAVLTLLVALLASVSSAPTAPGQAGDRKDRPGMVQKPLPDDLDVPPAPVLAPEEALARFEIADGYRIELVASEPMIHDPVSARFGADGRLWVVEMRGYMPDADGNGEQEPNGRVVVLRDRDGDGRMDEAVPFLERLVLPRAVLPLHDGALVLVPPRLMFFRDADGDGRADGDGEVVGEGFGQGLKNPEHAANDPELGADGWIRFARYGKRLGGWRTREWVWEPIPGAGQWGLSQDDEGRYFSNGNSDCLRVHLFPPGLAVGGPERMAGIGHQVVRDQEVWPARMNPGVNRGYRKGVLRDDWTLRRFTGACGPHLHRGGVAGLTGDVFVAEPAGNLVRRVDVQRDGAVLSGDNPHGAERREFLASTDERFRPVGFCDGPDGALYVVDFYRGLIQHKIFLTTFLRRQAEERGLVAPAALGRIWRVVRADAPAAAAAAGTPTRPWIADQQDVVALAEGLAHPEGWWRERAQQLLLERTAGDEAAERKVAGRLRRWIGRAGVPASGRRLALWTLEQMGRLEPRDLWTALDAVHAEGRVHTAEAAAGETGEADRVVALRGASVAPLVRAACFALAERWTRDEGRSGLVARARLMALATDASVDGSIRHAALVALSKIPEEGHRVAALQRLLGAGGDLAVLVEESALMRDALAGLAVGCEERALPTLLATGRASDEALLRRIAQGPAQRRDGRAVLGVLEAAVRVDRPALRRAVLVGLGERAPGPNAKKIALPATPVHALKLQARASAPGAQDDGAAELVTRILDVCSWPEAGGSGPRPLTPAEEARIALGAEVYRGVCASCHMAGGEGARGVAPPLRGSSWVLGPPGRLLRIVLHGVHGPIEVDGETYNYAAMPGHAAALDDERIAAVTSFVRRSWDHGAEPIEAADVAAVRARHADRDEPWTAPELRE